MKTDNEEIKRIKSIAAIVKEEAAKSEARSSDHGCCYITKNNGQRKCFDDVSCDTCQEIGEQAHLPWEFLPRQSCQAELQNDGST